MTRKPITSANPHHDRLPIQNPHEENSDRLAAISIASRPPDRSIRTPGVVSSLTLITKLRTPMANFQGESEVALSTKFADGRISRIVGSLSSASAALVLVVDDMSHSHGRGWDISGDSATFISTKSSPMRASLLRSLARLLSSSHSRITLTASPIVAENLCPTHALELWETPSSIAKRRKRFSHSARHGRTRNIARPTMAQNSTANCQPEFFERFFRGDRPRTSANPQSGAGWVFPSQNGIAESHHGTLELSHSGRKVQYSLHYHEYRNLRPLLPAPLPHD